jgi:hypothetical protein
MAKQEEDPRRPTPVARDGAYVMMLFVSLAAIIAGCVLLYLDNDEYGKNPPPKESVIPVQAFGTAAKLETPAAPAPPVGDPMPPAPPAPAPPP